MLREIIKERYQSLSLREKKGVGEALVKVNLGVAVPSEIRIVAEFLKGTGLVAKSQALDEVIEAIHDDPEAKMRARVASERTMTVYSEELKLGEEAIKGITIFAEDEEVTDKMKKP